MTHRVPRGWPGAAALAAALIAGGCAEIRDQETPPPSYDSSVRRLLVGTGQSSDLGACGECHGVAPEAGWSVLTYLSTVACVDRTDAEGLPVPAVLPQSEEAPILAVLDDPTHAGLLGDAERRLLRDWVAAGSPLSRGAAHPVGYGNPRSDAFHAQDLRDGRWARMLDPDARGACGACHAGSPNSTGTAIPGAPRCTSCHQQPAGVLDCGTCHGVEGVRANPPGDLCFFPEELVASGAHLGHPPGVACSSCHAERTVEGLADGLHGNGVAELDFDPAVAGPNATWDPEAQTCTNACHNRGGTEPTFLWDVTQALDCNACHLSPPPDHYAGPCNLCHREVNAEGTEYFPGTLHGNGVVDFGGPTGGCGGCHGDGLDDPWPESGAHPSHQFPEIARMSPCSSCHPIPSTVIEGEHLDGVVQVNLEGLAAARGQTPSYDPATQSCADVACHGAGLRGGALVPTPEWDDPSGAAGECGACHQVPPPPPHSQRSSCGLSYCHAGVVNGFGLITERGREVHVNGLVNLGGE